MNDSLDLGEAQAPARLVPENPSNDFDVTTQDGQVIRHRLVYIKDRPEPHAFDYRVIALQEAVRTYSATLRVRNDDQDLGPEITALAEDFYGFLTNDVPKGDES